MASAALLPCCVRQSPGLSRVVIDTPAGEKVLELQSQEDEALTFRASMGIPQDIRPIDSGGRRNSAVALSVGNPQCVLLDDPLVESRLSHAGASHRTPSEVSPTARMSSPQEWKRPIASASSSGSVESGPTQASGTGACGAASRRPHTAAHRATSVISPGGSQRVEWREDGCNRVGETWRWSSRDAG